MLRTAKDGARGPWIRCGMCSGRGHIDDVWLCCRRCGWSGNNGPTGAVHRLRVALAIPGRTWWTVHGPTAAAFGFTYRVRARLAHSIGRHVWSGRCSWCGKIRGE